MNLTDLFDLATARKASDIHLAAGETPRLRVGGVLVPLSEAADAASLLDGYLTPDAAARLHAGLPAERSIVHGGHVFNGVAFRAGSGLVATFRILQKGVPPLEIIAEGAEAFFRRLADRARGLVLVTGPAISGKTTTALSLVDAINAERPVRVFVVSGGASHVFESKRGLVTHLRVGQDCAGYVEAMQIARDADLDVITLDDLPDQAALREALVLAETGHLVVANLHADTAAEAVARLIESAGDEAKPLRRALAENLVAVTGQRLLPRIDRPGRVPLYEWIENVPTVRTALLAGEDLAEVQRANPECRTLGVIARDTYMSGKVSLEDAYEVCRGEGLTLEPQTRKDAEGV